MTELRQHDYHAVAFVENLPLRELAAEILEDAPSMPSSGRPLYDLRKALGGGEVFYFAFG